MSKDLKEEIDMTQLGVSDGAGQDSGKTEYSNCLMPLLDALGWRGSSFKLVEALPFLSDEMDEADFLNAMANLSFESHTQKAVLNTIDGRLMPCLFVLDTGSVYVLLKGGRESFYAFEGSTSSYKQIPVSLQRGSVIFFKIMESDSLSLLQRQKDWFSRVLKRFKNLFYLVAGISLLLSLLAIVSPLFIMSIYDQVLGAQGFTSFGLLTIGISIYVLGDAGFRLLRSRILEYISVRESNIVGNQILRRILYIPSTYTETASVGSQVSRINDFENVREFFSGSAIISLFDLPFTLLLLCGMIAIAGDVAYVPVVAIAIFIVGGLVATQAIKGVNAEQAKAVSKRQEFIVELLTNYRALKYLGLRNRWRQRYKDLSSEAATSTYYAARLNAVINTFSYMLVTFAGVMTMTFGVLKVFEGELSMGGLMASMILVWRILAPLRTGFGVMTQVGRIQKSVIQINRLMNMPLGTKNQKSMSSARRISGSVEFSKVSIRYSVDAHPALLGVSFSISEGEMLAVIGHDGAGKTTLLKLVLGLYNPQAGRVLVDNLNVQQMDPISLRQSIGYLSESDQFFHGTIEKNIKLAKPTATREEVTEAVKKANIYDDIMDIESNFDFFIGEHNLNQFSISFRRRLGLARMLVKGSSLILVDEPEKGMEEREISSMAKTMDSMKGKASIIVVTHSTEVFNVADKILWLDKGKVRMFGTAQEVSKAYIENV